MEDILSNIHNIDDTHVSTHHVNFEDMNYERPSVFNEKAWEAARASYEQQVIEYNKLNWFKKLFTPVPLEPLYADYVMY